MRCAWAFKGAWQGCQAALNARRPRGLPCLMACEGWGCMLAAWLASVWEGRQTRSETRAKNTPVAWGRAGEVEAWERGGLVGAEVAGVGACARCNTKADELE